MAGRENPLSAADTPPPVLQISSSEPEGPGNRRTELESSTWVSSPSTFDFPLSSGDPIWPDLEVFEYPFSAAETSPPVLQISSSEPERPGNRTELESSTLVPSPSNFALPSFHGNPDWRDLLEIPSNLPAKDIAPLPPNVGSASPLPQPPEIGELAEEVILSHIAPLPPNVGSASTPPQPPEIGELAEGVPNDGLLMEHSKFGGDEKVSSEIETSSAAPVNISEGNQEVNYQEPRLKMTFSSLEEAIKYYDEYAMKMGFKVRRGKGYHCRKGTLRSKILLCANEGLKSKKQLCRKKKFTKKETRTDCKAMIKFSEKNGNWEVCKFIHVHNHGQQCSTQKHDIDSCSKIPEADSLAQVHEIGTVREAAAAAACARFCDTNYSKHLPTKIMNHLQPDDSQGLLDYFKKLNVEAPSFFYALQVDAESRPTNFFWRDGISKIDYSYFSDFLTLDTTLRTVDRYKMICAQFWGLNHHKKMVLFGCALLLDEYFESFAWLLGTFMEAMDWHQPKFFFTTECPEISKAVEVILPKSQHRLCKKLVCQNAKQHLAIHYKQPEFESRFHSCLFDCQSDLEFQSIGNSLLEEYHLHENLWLQKIYALRTRRSYLFSKETCCAGIHPNQGSENFSHADVFQNMESQAMTLPKYVQKYEKAAEQQRREELHDFCCSGGKPELILNNPMEQQAANVYTPTMFEIFRREFIGTLSASFESIMRKGSIETFKVTFNVTEGRKTQSMVEFNSLDSTIRCSCKMFESIGILCVHALRILNTRPQNIFEIPPRYILRRWTRFAKDRVVDRDRARTLS